LKTAGTLPAPLETATDYYVRDLAGRTFKLAETAEGEAIDITDCGTNVHSLILKSKKQKMIRVARCLPDYTGTIDVTFSGIIMASQKYGYPMTWPDPNKKFTVPRKWSWDSSVECNKYIWQTQEPSDDGWYVIFTWDNRYQEAFGGPNTLIFGGQLYLRRAGSIVEESGVAFEAHSHGKEILAQGVPLQGNKTVDVNSGRHSYLSGGKMRDRISVQVGSAIRSIDIPVEWPDESTPYMYLGCAIGHSGMALIEGGELFFKEMGLA
jgi:hypothetical protein